MDAPDPNSKSRDFSAARPWLVIAGFFGLTALMAAAYGWHALGGDDFFDRGANIQLVHAVALTGVAWLAARFGGRLPMVIGLCLALGTVLFSGSLYVLALTGDRLFPHSAPLGGYLLMAGWGLIAWVGIRPPQSKSSTDG